MGSACGCQSNIEPKLGLAEYEAKIGLVLVAAANAKFLMLLERNPVHVINQDLERSLWINIIVPTGIYGLIKQTHEDEKLWLTTKLPQSTKAIIKCIESSHRDSSYVKLSVDNSHSGDSFLVKLMAMSTLCIIKIIQNYYSSMLKGKSRLLSKITAIKRFQTTIKTIASNYPKLVDDLLAQE